jgi:large subunit ribosomal protein L29
MAKAKEYRDRSVEQLELVHEDLCKEVYFLRNEQRETGKMEKPHLLGTTRKEIARVLTVMNEKKREG